MSNSGTQRRLAAILAADVVGYSRLVGQDEAGTLAAIKRLRHEVIDPLLTKHHGRIVKLMGDGALAEFTSVVDAVSCAVAVQKESVARQVGSPPEKRIVFRIGVNLGDVVVEDGDLLGDGVNVAARLEQLCEPGGVLISGTAYDHLQGKLGLPLDYSGEQFVKNMARPVRTYRVNIHGRGQPWRLRVRQYSRHGKWAAALIAIGLAIGLYWHVFLRVPVETSDIPSVAVLPFDDMSGRSEFSYFGDGVAEDIISMLSRVPDLKVVARNSSFTYKGQPVDVRKIGAGLGVTHILEGSVRKDADQVRIVAQLVDAKTGEHVWAERFDRSGPDPWALQDEVTEKIVMALVGDNGKLRREQYRDAWGKDSTNLQEYDYYLRAHALVTLLELEPVERAMKVAEEGLSKFPESALLKIELGLAYFIRGYNGWSDDLTADYQRAGTLVREAWAKPALSPMERRLGYNLLAYVQMSEKKFDEALNSAEAAIKLSPYDVYMLAGLSQISVSAGKPEQALEWLDRAASLDANPVMAQEMAYYRGWALVVLGRLEEALVELRKDRSGTAYNPLMQAIVLHRLGRNEEATLQLKNALTIDPKFTQAKWRELEFYSDPNILEREIADLASLGLPE
jgi:TolB-like protein/class 3 adenylate cyclase